MAADATSTLRPNADEPMSVLLMNTVWADRAGVHDALTNAGELGGWLAEVRDRLPEAVGGHSSEVRAQDVDAFRELRAALRRLAADATGDDRAHVLEVLDGRDTGWAADVVNAASAAAPPVPTLAWPARTAHRTVPTGVRPPVAALSAVAASAVKLFGESDPIALRACRAPGCVLYFVKDHPRREWCSDACGNRARARRHYERHRAH